MKKYNPPYAEYIKIDPSDVISTSGEIVLPGAPVSLDNEPGGNENTK